MNVWILAVYLQILDLLTTLLFLAEGLSEINPVVKFFLKHFKLPGLFLVKFLPIVFIILIYLVGKKYQPRWLNLVRMITRVNYIYAAIVGWNITVLVYSAYGRV